MSPRGPRPPSRAPRAPTPGFRPGWVRWVVGVDAVLPSADCGPGPSRGRGVGRGVSSHALLAPRWALQ